MYNHKQKVNMIQCYIPTNDESVKEEFYMKLKSSISNLKNCKIEILKNDLNAKIE